MSLTTITQAIGRRILPKRERTQIIEVVAPAQGEAKAMQEEVRKALWSYWPGADVLVTPSSPEFLMIQIIYPRGYEADGSGRSTIFSFTENLCVERFGCGFSGGFRATPTFLRAWVKKDVLQLPRN